MIKEGSDFSGVGAFQQALIRLGIPYETVFACDMDKYARQSFIANYGEPGYYPENVYDRIIPENPLDIYMTSPPCQGFSIAGKREGSILFLNSHEFIRKNNPRFFIFENVKGLLSHEKKDKTHDYGSTFNQWIYYLGGKSINGSPVIFPHEESVPYHIYWRVLNSKEHGVPQNRERVFIVGIRDDIDNVFSWPKTEPLTKKLKDILEPEVDEKYFLSEKSLNQIAAWNSQQNPLDKIFDKEDIMSCILARGDGELHAGMKLLRIKSGTKRGYDLAKKGDSINIQRPTSETRKGRVGKGVAQALDTACEQVVVQDNIRRLTPRECFRLQDFPDSFEFVVSDTQLYKQAGNSITVGVLAKIISKLNL